MKLTNMPFETSAQGMNPEGSTSVNLYDNGGGVFEIRVSVEGGINTLSEELIVQLKQAIDRVRQEPNVKVLIISGTEQSFLSGGKKNHQKAIEHKFYKAIASFPYPIIASMQGDAMGAGFLVGALCDFMVCSMDGRYGYTNPTEDLYPKAQEDTLLMERFGEIQSSDLLYQSIVGSYTGEQLREKGWTCPILPRDQVEIHAQTLASNLSKKTQDSLQLLKQHLARSITPLADGFGITGEVSTSPRGAAKNSKKPITSTNLLRVEARDNILLLGMSKVEKSSDIKSMVSDLSNVLGRVGNASKYQVAILTSEHPDFLSESASAEDIEALGTLILGSTIPIIAILSSNAQGKGWFVSHHCDATVYHARGRYSTGDILHFSELAGQTTMIFTHRLGTSLGQEVLLTGRVYKGSELQERMGTLMVAAQDELLGLALRLAESWAIQPLDTLIEWKKRKANGMRSKTENLPVWPEVGVDFIPQYNKPTPVSLKSKVIIATAYPEGILEIRMEDRTVKNMFSPELIDGVNEIYAHIEQSSAYKVVVLTGYDSYFASGGTKEGLLAIQEGKVKFTDTKIYQLAMECKIPVIAGMQGHGIGAGWCLGMFADLPLFSEESKYVSPYMSYGFTPGAGATMIFPHTIGYDLARETMLTGQEYFGSELKSRGIQHIVLPRKQIHAAAMSIAKDVAKHPINSLIGLKQQMTQHLSSEVEEAYRLELSMHEKTFVGQADTLKQIQKNFTPENHRPQVEIKSNEMPINQEKKEQSLNIGTLLAVTANVKKFLAEELHLQENEIDEKVQFVDLGLDSIIGVSLIRKINERYKTSIEATKIYSYPTVEKLGRYVKEEAEKQGAIPTSSFTEKVISRDQTIIVQHQSVGTISTVTAIVKKFLAEELHLQENEIDEKVQFVDLGLDSIIGVSLIRKINERFKTSIEATKIYSYPTVEKLGRYVKEEAEKQGTISTSSFTEKVISRDQTIIVQHQSVGTISTVTAIVKKFLAEELHLQENEIDEKVQFVDLGLDSIIGVSLIRKINERFKTSIEATKIYSYPTIEKLGRYVKEEAEKQGAMLTDPADMVIPTTSSNRIQSLNKWVSKSEVKKISSWRNQASLRSIPVTTSSNQIQPIAVIGMAGQFPQADNIEEFWQNIAQGKNCIREVPQKRWDSNIYYQEGNPSSGKTNSKWLGTLDGYDLFDPLFFTISPIEAESMDPQQRLFLQSCWHSIEDAGYNTQTLSGSKCGVFVGCATGDYQLLSREQQLSAQGFTGGAASILAARISYFLNLQGPCIAIETACSSSLVAIATACDSLISGGSDMALAGGVFVMTGPEMHIKTAQSGMLSQDGRCHTFDQKANGFVPGEGVGVVMLKRLADAERDQDTIYGVIQGWGVNQDGKTNGITAPNAESQTRLEQEVYDKYGIDPNQIQLIENHGTGTKLGDPIEVDALKQAFKKYTQKKDYCALGSVKSNIGHCLTAAGVASFIKVLLSLEHKQLPPTINFENLNEHINLKDTPFYVNTQLKDWVVTDSHKRQAAISAFGFSGTNAHIVVAEYIKPSNIKKAVSVITQDGKIIVPLSARNIEQLKEKTQDLLSFLRKNEGSIDLIDMAYTLQVAREAMEERLGFMVGSVEELIKKLSTYLDGGENIEDVFQGQVKRNKEGLKLLIQDDDMKETIVGKWVLERKLGKLLDLWVKGLEFNWNKLYDETKPKRIHLPVYPFAKEHYWIEVKDIIQQTLPFVAASNAIHPLLHKKVVDIREQGYISSLTGKESLFADGQEDEKGSIEKKIQLISLPTYPFLGERCWPEILPTNIQDSNHPENTPLNLELIEDVINKVDNDSMDINHAINLLKGVV